MRPKHIQNAVLTLFLGISLFALLDCREGSEGTLGNLLFFDLTREPGDLLNLAQEVDRAVAVGATVDIEIRTSQRQEAVVTAASSSNEGVLAVSNTLRAVVQLEAIDSGTALLEVTAGGLDDSLAIAAAPVATTGLEILPWGESTLLPQTVYAGGVVLTPETNTSLFLRHRDASGHILTGYGAKALSANPSGATLSATAGSDFYTLTAMDTVGTINLTTQGLEESIEVVSVDDIESITLNDVNNNGLVVPSTYTVSVGARWYTVGAYTEGLEYVIAPFGTSFEVDIDDGDELLVEYVDFESEEGRDLLDDSRAFFLDFKMPGNAAFTVRWLDFELPFEVTILPDDTE